MDGILFAKPGSHLKSSFPVILTIQSTTFSAYGGIPTYNRVVCRALNELIDPVEKHVLVVTDTPGDLEAPRGEFPNLTLTAFSGKRWAFVRAVLRLVLTRNVDLLLVGHVNYAPLGLLMRLLRPSLRYGVMVHGVDVWSRLSRIKRQALRRADFISSVSEYTKQQVVSVNQVDAQRIYVLPNSLEWKENGGQAASPSQTSRQATRLLTVCRLSVHEGYKGVDTVIRTLPSVIRAVPDLQYFVVGSGSDLERHRRLASKHSVSDRVHFLGSVDVESLQAQYRSCDIFVMPSAGEGFGIVFLEAMRYSKPVVAAESGAVPEVVEDQVTGRLVEYGNKDELAQALIELCLDPEKRTRLGAAGYQRLQERFTFVHFKKKLTEILAAELPLGMAAGTEIPVSQSTPQLP
jgi:phosphatidyl-myo-inositol dimannoside synthase